MKIYILNYFEITLKELKLKMFVDHNMQFQLKQLNKHKSFYFFYI